LVLCWGAVPVLLRHLSSSIDAWTANGFRYPLAAVLYWPVLLAAYRGGSLDRETIRRCAVPAFFALAGQVLWALAPYYLSASSIGFFIRLSLVFTLLGAMYFFPDERPLLKQPWFHVGLTLSVGGFLVLAMSRGMFDVKVTVTGVTIITVCSMFFGLYSVSVRHYLRGMHPLVGFGVVSQIVSLGTLTGMVFLGRPQQLLELSGGDWAVLIVSSVLGVAVGHFLLYTAVQRLGATIPPGVGTLSPFFTVLLAAVFLGESLSPAGWLAGVMMVLGALALLVAQHLLWSRLRRA
jgi:drug/metabolite transporter (DMT)-like permease